MRRIVCVLALLATACTASPAEAPTTTGATTSPSSTTSSVPSSTSTPGTTLPPPTTTEIDTGAGWEVFVPVLEVPPPVFSREGDLMVFPPAQLSRVVAVEEGYVGVGSAQGGLAAWRSEDGHDWDLIHHEPWVAGPSDRLLSIQALLAVGDERLLAFTTVLLGPTSDRPDLSPVTVVLRSDDGGETWQRAAWHDDLASMVNDVEITPFGLVAVGNTYPYEPEPGPLRPAVWRSDDFGDNWYPVARQGEAFTGDGGINDLVSLADGLLAVGQVDMFAAVWRSPDGTTWTLTYPDAFGDGGDPFGVIAFSDEVVVLGEAWEEEEEEGGWIPTVLWSSPDGSAWTPWPLDPAFGDLGDGPEFFPLLEWRGRLLIGGRVSERSNPQFCFQDLATCQQSRSALIWGSPGSWERIALDPLLEHDRIAQVVTAGDRLIVLTPARYDGDPPQVVGIWTGRGTAEPAASPVVAPTTTVPPLQVLAPEVETLEVGVTWRYVFMLEGCGSEFLAFNGITWKRTRQEVRRPDWPTREGWVHAFTVWVYGTITLVDPTHIEIRVESGDLVAVFEPTDEEPYGCM